MQAQNARDGRLAIIRDSLVYFGGMPSSNVEYIWRIPGGLLALLAHILAQLYTTYSMALAAPLARVKLTRPPIVQELVPRHRLLDWLDDATKKPVTVLAAPAGYGKSTLVAAWQSRGSHRTAWLSLDEGDNNLCLFAGYFVAAIGTIFPGSLSGSGGLINSSVAPEPLQLATMLSNEIAELPHDFVLVLDDYHTLTDPAVHAFMSGLIARVPEPLHLIISTRTNAPLPLAKLRASGRLGELRARDLRFTLDETRQFCERALDQDIPFDLVRRLQERIEGWAVGLRLATLVFRETLPTAELVERLVSGSDGHMMEYMLGEVLLQKSPGVQDFLLKTSYFPRFTLELSQAILDLPAPEKVYAMMDELVRDEILSVEQDGAERWYKYHDLFREFLRARAVGRYDAQTMAGIHRRASAWFLETGQVTEAIQHAIAAGEEKRAAQIVWSNIAAALDQPWARPLIEQWLRQFSEEMLDAYPELVLARLWLASIALKLSAFPPLLERAGQLLAAEETASLAYRLMLSALEYQRGALAYFENDAPRTLEHMTAYAHHEPIPSDYVRGTSLSIEAWALQMSGKTDAGLEMLTAALQSDGMSSLMFTLRVMNGFSNLYANCGDWINLEQNGRTILRLTQASPSLGTAAAYYSLGLVYYEWNELEAAAQNFAAAAELSQPGNLKIGQESFGWLALTRQTQGSPAAANEALQSLVAFTDAAQSGALLYDLEAYRARLALLQGNVDAALHWALGVMFNPKPHMLFEVETNLSRLYILVTARKPEHVRATLEEIQALLTWCEAMHSTRRLIQILALYAMALDACGNRVKALDALERAIILAEPGKWMRTWLDLGPGMARLLNQLVSRRRSAAYINRILMAGAQTEKKRLVTDGNAGERPSPLIEPLTMRELQVLGGMARRRSNKEIAQELVISPQTVKAHVDHIHQKLGVNNRHDAAKVALAFGIIDLPAGMGEF